MEERFHEAYQLRVPMYNGALPGAEAVRVVEEAHQGQHLELHQSSELANESQTFVQQGQGPQHLCFGEQRQRRQAS